MMSRALLHRGVSFLGLCIAVGVAAPALAQSSASSFAEGYRWDKLRRLVGTITPSADGSTGPFIARRVTYNADSEAIKVEDGELSAWQAETIHPADWSGFTVRQSTHTDYDNLQRKIREYVRQPDGSISSLTQYKYDDAGRLQCTAVRMNPAQYFTQIDACVQSLANASTPDQITVYTYDAAGRLTQEHKAVGSSVQEAYATYSYTPSGKVEFSIDSNGNRSKVTYDGFDRPDWVIFPSKARLPLAGPGAYSPLNQGTALETAGTIDGGNAEHYTYDANGNPLTWRKRDGSVISYQYDALNRLTAKWMPELAWIPVGRRRHTYYSYDLRGLLTSARFDSATGEGVTIAYDGFGRPVSSALNMEGVNRTLSYEYDSNGNRTKITHPDGLYFRSTYNGRDQFDRAFWPGETQFAQAFYNGFGKRYRLNAGSSDTYYTYGADQRLQNLQQHFAGGIGNDVQTFAYSPASQLVNETRNNPVYTFTARYNVDRTYITNGLNQYETTTSTTTAGTGSNTFCHDASGNLIADGAYVYAYDIENRLVEKRQKATTSCSSFAFDGPIMAQLQYDPLGRLYKTIGPSTGTTRMLYDGDQLVAEYNENHILLRRYFWRDRSDELLLWSEGQNLDCGGARTQFLHHDRVGSVVSSADCSGNFVRAWRYDEYGIPQSSDGAPLRPSEGARFLYTGQAFIPDAGLYYYKARMYSPTLGRFLQADPIGYYDQINLYAYVGNDPVNRRDPSGLVGEVVNGGDLHSVTVKDTALPNDGLALVGGLFMPPAIGRASIPKIAPALSPQSGQCRSPATSSAEAAAARRGDRDGYWSSRAARGDPLAATALGIVRSNTALGVGANTRLISRLISRNGANPGRSALSREVNQIGIELMQAHVAAVNQFGSPSAEQIAQYHFDVFGAHGLAADTFGGAPLTGSQAEAGLTSGIWMGC